MALELGLIYSLVTIGIYLTFRIIDFTDLTCDGSFVLGAVSSTMCAVQGMPPIVCIMVGGCAGGLTGLCTGLLHTTFKITDLLCGILVAFMLYSINLRILGGVPNVSLLDAKTLFMGTSYPFLLLVPFSFFTVLILGYFLSTDLGLAFRSVGQNKKLACLMGVNPKKMILLGLVLSNGCIALGGALFAQHQGFSDVSMGFGTVITGLASLMIAERLMPFRPIIVRLLACVMGSILYRVFISIALHSDAIGIKSHDLNLVTGVLMITIMALSRRKKSC